MSYIAFLDTSNIVTRVVKSPEDGQDWVKLWSAKFDCVCIETSRSGEFRHEFALPGYLYLDDVDAFVRPSPYPSWILDTSVPGWVPPVPAPADGKDYSWIEATESWIESEPLGEFFDIQ